MLVPQADVNCEVVFTWDSTKHNNKNHVLKILKKFQGLCQAINVWFNKLRDALLWRGFNKCMNLYKESTAQRHWSNLYGVFKRAELYAQKSAGEHSEAANHLDCLAE